jgi:hypothetical protein
MAFRTKTIFIVGRVKAIIEEESKDPFLMGDFEAVLSAKDYANVYKKLRSLFLVDLNGQFKYLDYSIRVYQTMDEYLWLKMLEGEKWMKENERNY